MRKKANHIKMCEFPKDLINKESKKSIEIREYSMSSLSPLLQGVGITKPSIPLIAIGGAGINILQKIIERIKMYDIEYSAAAIDLDWKKIDSVNITHKLKLGDSGMGTSTQFRIGTKIAKEKNEKITAFLNSYLDEFEYKSKHNIVFIFMGSGGTGVGVGLETIKRLKSLGYRPVPFLVLPEEKETTRVRFTAAVGIYYFSFAPGERSEGLMTILIENQRFYDANKKLSEEALLNFINSRLGVTIGDLLISTEMHSDGYSTDLNEFLEVFRTVKGVGSIVDIKSSSDTVELASFLKDNISESVAYASDPLSATRSFILIHSIGMSVTSVDMRNSLSLYGNSDIFPKYSVGSSDGEKYYRILSIFSGLEQNKSLRELMLDAEDNRVNILNHTKEQMMDGSVIQKIEKVKDGDQIEVKSAEELRDTLALEAAAKRRGEFDE